jgi:cytochrome c peroxidase
MSFSLVRLLAGGLVIAAVTSGALGQERHFNRHAMIEPHHPAERWEDNTLAVLGQKLFFDVRLSRTGTTACASCHHPGYAFAEPRRVSVSDSGNAGRRNAPSLINAGYLTALMWDGRFRTLEQQALSPFGSAPGRGVGAIMVRALRLGRQAAGMALLLTCGSSQRPASVSRLM